jgi:hypothetical protein
MDLMDTSGTEHSNVTIAAKAAKLQIGTEWVPSDLNNDGFVTGADIPYEPGTFEAKMAFKSLSNYCHSPSMIAKAKALSGNDACTGMYAGKILVPGITSEGGDFQMLVDRLHYANGYDFDAAGRIAGAIKARMAG